MFKQKNVDSKTSSAGFLLFCSLKNEQVQNVWLQRFEVAICYVI